MPQSTSANAALKCLRRKGMATRNTPAKTNPALVHSKLCNAADGAVVVIVSDALPLPMTLPGVNAHVLSKGNPVHEALEKLIVLL
jgi:hypothetical protein